MITDSILDNFSSAVGADGLGCVLLAGNSFASLLDRLIKSEFRNLNCIYLYNNNIQTLKTRSFNFIRKLGHLSLSGNQLTFIEPGAFQGNLIEKLYPIILAHFLCKYIK